VILLVSLVLGIFVLDAPWSWVVVIAGATLELAETTLFVWWSKRRKTAVGTETLVGRRAVVSVECRPRGQVRVAGEIWQAQCDEGAGVGEEVVVRAVEGLSLVVEPA
jgi:membrane-bound serine protease (ClpP class)